jgi:hypothetical protein
MDRIYTQNNFKDIDTTSIECAICKDIIYKPYMIIECGHTFCQGCIEKWIDIKKECPLCKKTITEKTVQNLYFANEKLNKLKYHCLNSGCDVIVNVGYEYNNIKKHINECEHKILYCKYCQDHFKKKDYTEHSVKYIYEEKTCNNMKSCENDQCYEIIKKNKLDEHINNCPFRKIECEKCESVIIYKESDSHIKSSKCYLEYNKLLEKKYNNLKQENDYLKTQLKNIYNRLI